MCSKLQECQYQKTCNFAHSKEELLPMPKWEMCEKNRNGTCKHSQDSSKVSIDRDLSFLKIVVSKSSLRRFSYIDFDDKTKVTTTESACKAIFTSEKSYFVWGCMDKCSQINVRLH